MSKTYTAPTLVAHGSLIGLTQFGVGGTGDPQNRINGLEAAPGSMGFQL
jgi:hypothetical protein